MRDKKVPPHKVGRPDATDVAERWAKLQPEPGIVDALNRAGPRPTGRDQDKKRSWSEKFAHACAVAFADELRSSTLLAGKTIKPAGHGQGTETLVPLGSSTSKRIDVTVVDQVLGLEIGISLKGLNFRDDQGGQFDKNLTGRLYELSDEVRFVHENLPRAFMCGVFFLPLESTGDKTVRSPSSFARCVLSLRSRTGRIDATIAGQASKCDSAYVALYTLGSNGFPAGVVRLMNVSRAPPRRGRPKLSDTLSLRDAVEEIVRQATHSAEEEWSDPESDQE